MKRQSTTLPNIGINFKPTSGGMIFSYCGIGTNCTKKEAIMIGLAFLEAAGVDHQLFETLNIPRTPLGEVLGDNYYPPGSMEGIPLGMLKQSELVREHVEHT